MLNCKYYNFVSYLLFKEGLFYSNPESFLCICFHLLNGFKFYELIYYMDLFLLTVQPLGHLYLHLYFFLSNLDVKFFQSVIK